MRRRTFVAGLGGTTLAGLAGCLGDGTDAVNGHLEVGGVTVPLVSTTTAVSWYDEDETVYVDARSEAAFEELRIDGAHLSPAPDGLGADDPVGSVGRDERIVTYCVCPHTLAGQRAAALIDDGYESVYALDEGLQSWVEHGAPVAGTATAGSMGTPDVPEARYHG